VSKILVSGLINVETTLRVDGFPIEYFPVRYPFQGVNSSVSGVGYNVTKALTTLGDCVTFLSMIGTDPAGLLVRKSLYSVGIGSDFIVEGMKNTPQSVILYDSSGRRQINVDLKDIQEKSYPAEIFERAIDESKLAVLCNINFSRAFLPLARRAGKLIATDVHAISSLEDEYNRDFMSAADILFMSDEWLPYQPEEWVRMVFDCYRADVVVVGLGDKGALMGVRSDHFIERLPAIPTRPVVNTIGAGDALFSCFIHYYCKTGDPYEAIQKGMVFSSYKIGEAGAADGFLDEMVLEQLCDRIFRIKNDLI
jgi:sugar/nucleoside kinase (ribokinase family)